MVNILWSIIVKKHSMELTDNWTMMVDNYVMINTHWFIIILLIICWVPKQWSPTIKSEWLLFGRLRGKSNMYRWLPYLSQGQFISGEWCLFEKWWDCIPMMALYATVPGTIGLYIPLTVLVLLVEENVLFGHCYCHRWLNPHSCKRYHWAVTGR